MLEALRLADNLFNDFDLFEIPVSGMDVAE
jgi:hypothetical protein